MVRNPKLIQGLLRELEKREGAMHGGGSIEVLAPYDRHVPGTIIVEPYTPEQIHRHLEMLVSERLVETDAISGGPGLGIMFSRLTNAGHRLLA
jgi:hypothetical protein